MTNQEAIADLETLLAYIPIYLRFYRPISMGIKALKQVDMLLQDMKKEIELKEKTLTDKYGQVKYGVWTDDVCNVFDKYIEKYSNT